MSCVLFPGGVFRGTAIRDFKAESVGDGQCEHRSDRPDKEKKYDTGNLSWNIYII